MFKQIEVEVVPSASERFAIHTISQSTAAPSSTGHEFVSLAPMASDIDFLENALQKLLAMVDTTQSYVNKVSRIVISVKRVGSFGGGGGDGGDCADGAGLRGEQRTVNA